MEETKKKPKLLELIKHLSTTVKCLIGGVLAVVVIGVILLVVFAGSGKITISIESSLKEIAKVAELNSAKYIYNSIIEVKDGDTTKYYVSYKGEVTAGISFDEIKVTQEGNIIRIILPSISISAVDVMDEMNYIFLKDKYDTERTYAEARNLCEMDLKQKAENNETLFEFARESAKNTVLGLVKPFESQLKNGQVFDVVFADELAQGVVSSTATTSTNTTVEEAIAQ